MIISNKIDITKFRLQYITNENSRYSHIESAKLVLDGGCQWVQLRMKNTEQALILDTASQLSQLCKQYAATFIIDDNVFVAKEVDADGVHLGKNDMPIESAKSILSANKIIGATANTVSDVSNAMQAGADYIGLGPYKFTTTKQNLSHILGMQGYENIFRQLQNITIPIVAIGGIELEDVCKLQQAGVAGVAISGGILNSDNITKQTIKFLQEIKF